jgi:hypothetical protein
LTIYGLLPSVYTALPTVTAVSPAAGTTGVSVSAAITVTFSEALDPTTVNANNFVLLDSSNHPVAVTVTYNPATNTVTLQPTVPLNSATTYTLRVRGGLTGVKDRFGNPMAEDFTTSFTTS